LACTRVAQFEKEVAQMAANLDNYLDLLQQKKAFAGLATIMPDGTPQVTPVWFDYHGGRVRVNTAKGRVKARNLKPGAAVALSIMDPDNPYRYLQIRGRVTSATETGADAHIDSLAKKYLGKDQYPFRQPGEVRVMYEIEPVSVSGMS
jgi:PPOX class probable F420-dependent enzyme